MFICRYVRTLPPSFWVDTCSSMSVFLQLLPLKPVTECQQSYFLVFIATLSPPENGGFDKCAKVGVGSLIKQNVFRIKKGKTALFYDRSVERCKLMRDQGAPFLNRPRYVATCVRKICLFWYRFKKMLWFCKATIYDLQIFSI